MKRLISGIAVLFGLAVMAQDGGIVTLALSNVYTGAAPTSAESTMIPHGSIQRIIIDVGAAGLDATLAVLVTNKYTGRTVTAYSAANVATNVDIFPLIVANQTSGATTTNQYMRVPLYQDKIIFRGSAAAATNKNIKAFIIWTRDP